MLKLVIFGSRSFNDYDLLKKVCDSRLGLYPVEDILIISGGAIGADKLAERWSAERQLDHLIRRPKWDKYGKAAGYRRNVTMANECTEGIGFWDGHSNGTKHMMRNMLKLQRPLIMVNTATGERVFYNRGTEYEIETKGERW